MKRVTLSFFICLAVGSAFAQVKPLDHSPKLADVIGHGKSGPLTLDDALSIAFTTSPSLNFAANNLSAAHARLNQSKSATAPNISLAPGEVFLHRRAEESFGLQATLSIDISHLLADANDQAQFDEIAARLDVNRTRNDVAYRVISSFYGSLRADALVRVAAENLQNSTDRLADAEARYKARAVAYFDVIRAQTDLAIAQKQLIQARNNARGSLAILASSMGISTSEDFTISDAKAIVQPPSVETNFSMKNDMPIILGQEFKDLVAEATKNRPEALESEVIIAGAKKGVLVARRSEKPSLQAGVGYFDVRTQSGTRVNEPQAFLGFSIPIYDAGLGRARVDEAKSRVASAITSARAVNDSISLEVMQAYLALNQAQDQVRVANQALEQAKAGFDLARVRYTTGVSSRAGISPLLELSDAQAALTLAQENQVNSLYDYNTAKAQVERAAGRYAYSRDGIGYSSLPDSKSLGLHG